MKYEFLVNNNYAKRVVSESPSNDTAAVCAIDEPFEHLRWGGTLELMPALRLLTVNQNHLACVFSKGAYREVGDINWYHPTEHESLVCLVSNRHVMVLLENGVPFLLDEPSASILGHKVITPTSYTPKRSATVHSISGRQ